MLIIPFSFTLQFLDRAGVGVGVGVGGAGAVGVGGDGDGVEELPFVDGVVDGALVVESFSRTFRNTVKDNIGWRF